MSEPAPAEPTPAEPTHVKPASVEPTSVEPTSVEPTSEEPTAVETTSVVPAAVEPNPVGPTSDVVVEPEQNTVAVENQPETIAEPTSEVTPTTAEVTQSTETKVEEKTKKSFFPWRITRNASLRAPKAEETKVIEVVASSTEEAATQVTGNAAVVDEPEEVVTNETIKVETKVEQTPLVKNDKRKSLFPFFSKTTTDPQVEATKTAEVAPAVEVVEETVATTSETVTKVTVTKVETTPKVVKPRSPKFSLLSHKKTDSAKIEAIAETPEPTPAEIASETPAPAAPNGEPTHGIASRIAGLFSKVGGKKVAPAPEPTPVVEDNVEAREVPKIKELPPLTAEDILPPQIESENGVVALSA